MTFDPSVPDSPVPQFGSRPGVVWRSSTDASAVDAGLHEPLAYRSPSPPPLRGNRRGVWPWLIGTLAAVVLLVAGTAIGLVIGKHKWGHSPQAAAVTSSQGRVTQAASHAPPAAGHGLGTWSGTSQGATVAVQIPGTGTDADQLRSYLRRAGGKFAHMTVVTLEVDNLKGSTLAEASDITVINAAHQQIEVGSAVLVMNEVDNLNSSLYAEYAKSPLATRIADDQFAAALPGARNSTVAVLDGSISAGITSVFDSLQPLHFEP